MTYICRAHNTAYLLHGVQVWTQPTMHCEDLLINDSGDWKTVEAVCEGLPQLDVVSSFALIVEAVDTVDGGTFVVATQNEEVFWILDLVCQKQADCLEGLLATVHVVAKEEVVGLGWESPVLEQAEQVIVLTVYITTDLASLAIVGD